MKPDEIDCRLCGAPAAATFARRSDDGSEIHCYTCTACGSLQTEQPYWLSEVYAAASSPARLDLDTSAVARCLFNRIVVALLWKLGGFANGRDRLLDWGGGPGLFVRLLRDVGIDAYLYDKYARNHYATGFVRTEDTQYAFVTAFEVFEHFPDPEKDLEALFALQPSFLLISTSLFSGQGPDWPYLGPPKSEHVFFYSQAALALIGRRFGYDVLRMPHSLALFHKPGLSNIRLRVASRLIAHPRLAEFVFAVKRKWSLADEDSRALRQRVDAGRR